MPPSSAGMLPLAPTVPRFSSVSAVSEPRLAGMGAASAFNARFNNVRLDSAPMLCGMLPFSPLLPSDSSTSSPAAHTAPAKVQ